MDEEKLYEFWLPFAGMPDTPAQRAAIEYVAKYVTLAHDSQLHVVTYDEAVELISAGRMKPFTKYHDINLGELGAVATGWSDRYSKTWFEIAGVDRTTFLEGWDACEEYHKQEKYDNDWAEALKINARFDKKHKKGA